MQSELREGVLHRGKEHAGAEGTPEVGVGHAGGVHGVVSGYIVDYRQLEVSQGFQEILE